jgi:hypothetical protein
VTVDTSGNAPKTVLWTIDGSHASGTTLTPTTETTERATLYVAADETPGALTIRATTTFTGEGAGTSDSATVTVFTPVPLATPAAPSLSTGGDATWTGLAPETNVAGYSVQLYKGGVAEGDPVPVNQGGTYSVPFLNDMREAGVGTYTVKVKAVSTDPVNYPNSPESAASGSRTVATLATPTGPGWDGNYAQWTGVSNASSYSVQLYKNGSTEEATGTTSAAASPADLTQLLIGGKTGTYNYTVKAVGTGLYLDSPETVAANSGRKYFLNMNVSTNGGTAAAGKSIYSIAFGNDMFVAVGVGGTIMTSPNGKAWTAVDTDDLFAGWESKPDLRSVAWGEEAGKFVAVGRVVGSDANRKSTVIYSEDGTSWTLPDPAVFTYAANNPSLYAVTYGNGRFILAGEINNSGTGPRTAWSTDGISWNLVSNGGHGNSSTTSGTIRALAHGNQFVAAGVNGRVSTTSDGVEGNWTGRGNFLDNSTIETVAYGGYIDGSTNATWVMGGAGGRMAYTSTGSTGTWTNVSTTTFGSSSVLGIIFVNDVFVAVGGNGKMAASFNGSTWRAMPVGNQAGHSGASNDQEIRAAAFGNGTFVFSRNNPDDSGSEMMYSD